MFDFLFNPNGRISRKGFVLGFLPPWLLLTQIPGFIVPSGPDVGIVWTLVGLVVTLAGLFFLWPSFVAVPVKRLHDLGLSGFLQVIVPVLGLIGFVLIFVGMFNAYGGSPEDFALQFEGIESNAQAMDAVWPLIKASPLALVGMALVFAYVLEFIAFALIPGQRGPNQHGEDPLASGRGFAD